MPLYRAAASGTSLGGWDVNLQTNLVLPSPQEFDRAANPIAVPLTRQQTPTIEVTVTEDMLVTNTGGDIPYETVIALHGSARVLTGTGNVTIETAQLSAATGIETVLDSSTSGGPAAGTRFNFAAITDSVSVGDKLFVRIWCANGANYVLDWYAIRPVVTHWGYSRLNDNMALYRNINIVGTLNHFTPTTVLTGAPTNWTQGGNVSSSQWLDNDISIGTNAVPGQTSLIGGLKGINSIAGESQCRFAFSSTATSAQVHVINAPAQLRVDRLIIPMAP